MVQYPAQQLVQVRCVFSMHWRQLKSHSKQLRSIRHCGYRISIRCQGEYLGNSLAPGSDVRKGSIMVGCVSVEFTKERYFARPRTSCLNNIASRPFGLPTSVLLGILRKCIS